MKKCHANFETIRKDNSVLCINKDFRNECLEQALWQGEAGLSGQYQLTKVDSSDFARVYSFFVDFDGVKKKVYFKKFLHRSSVDLIKHIFRPSRAKRAFQASLMLEVNGFTAPAVVAMGELKKGPFCSETFLVTVEVENALPIHTYISDRSEKQLCAKRDLIRSLGRTIGRMHSMGIFHGDLRLGNILAKRELKTWKFFFLDNERTKKFCRLPARLRVKNLVQVNMFPPEMMTDTERMRFFKFYLAENKEIQDSRSNLAKKVVRKTSLRLYKKGHPRDG